LRHVRGAQAQPALDGFGVARAYPVGEITISSNFDALWKGVDAVGDDLDTRSSVQCPTFRVGRMMIAGS
jgi:predicted Zn-dependent protease